MTKKPRSLTHRTLGGMAWVAWGSAAMGLLKVGVLVALTRLLSPADFGVVGAALVVINFSLIFSQLGLGPALVQRPVLEPRHVSTAFVASTAFGLIVAAVVWLLAPWLAGFFRIQELVPVIRALSLVFPLAGISAAAENLLQRELRFRLLANRDVFSYAIGYGVVGVVLAFLGWGVWALVGAQHTQTLLRTVILLWASPPTFRPRPGWSAFRELMGYGAGQSAARIGVLLANQADNLVVGRWLGPISLGLYSRAYQLMAVPTALLGDVLDKVLFPVMALVQGDQRRLASAYVQGSAIIALVTLPLGAVTALLAPDLVAVAFGDRWLAMVPPFQVLALGMLFRTSYRMSDSLSRATGRVYRRAWRQLLYAAMVFVAALVGQRWGVTGVAIGVLGALFINYLLMAQLSLSVGQVSWLAFLQAQLPALRLTIVLGAVTLAITSITRHLGAPHLVILLAGGFGAAATAAAAAAVMPRFTLGEHGVRIGATVREYVTTRLRPAPLRGST